MEYLVQLSPNVVQCHVGVGSLSDWGNHAWGRNGVVGPLSVIGIKACTVVLDGTRPQRNTRQSGQIEKDGKIPKVIWQNDYYQHAISMREAEGTV